MFIINDDIVISTVFRRCFSRGAMYTVVAGLTIICVIK